MTTSEQIQTMLELMQQQMQTMQSLQQEDSQLRHNQSHQASSEAKPKRPDRQVIEANLTRSGWSLFEDTWKRYKAIMGLRDESERRMEKWNGK